LACKSLYDRVSQPEPSAPVGDPGAVLWRPQAEAFTKKLCCGYCKTLLMSRGPQALGVFGRGPQTMQC